MKNNLQKVKGFHRGDSDRPEFLLHKPHSDTNLDLLSGQQRRIKVASASGIKECASSGEDKSSSA